MKFAYPVRACFEEIKMKRRMTVALAISCWCTAAPALAAQSIDSLYWPETGRFPAYPEEPDTRRWTFSVFGGIDHDSNPFRLSDGQNPVTMLGSSEKSDNIYHGRSEEHTSELQSRRDLVCRLLLEKKKKKKKNNKKN